MKTYLKAIPFVIAGLLINTPLMASSHEDHSMHDHEKMTSSANEATGMGTVHKVDAEKKVVNLTHEPIPALNWPGMTMDLPVTKRVDLSTFKAGDEVHFTLKMGRDKQYRITNMKPAKMKNH
ncbi:MAG: copper-binding protein [Candidatus Thiodiazotropha sp. (ex Semelilucina semeliformis)]|nr:copper-binding protein [Candidatus Thiodiazotropha sp. (ex Semelilucina semeliformis)]